MEQQAVERRASRDISDDDKQFAEKKKSKLELEQEVQMARQYAIVIGELKAAEARNRVRATRLRFAKSTRDEIDQIIAFQPNALSALRFEAFMSNVSSSQKEKTSSSLHSSPRTTSALTNGQTKDLLTQTERRRVQNLLLDDKNLLVDRTG